MALTASRMPCTALWQAVDESMRKTQFQPLVHGLDQPLYVGRIGGKVCLALAGMRLNMHDRTGDAFAATQGLYVNMDIIHE